MVLAGTLVLLLASGAAQETVAVPAPAAAVDMAAFDAVVQSGQAQYLGGDFLGAAYTWQLAARMLPATPEQRGNLAAVHGYVADAYARALQRVEDPAMVRDALAVLDEYAGQFAAAYPGSPPTPRVEATREALRRQLTIVDAVVEGPPRPALVTRRPPPVVIRPWRPMAAGGGVALAGGAAMAAVFAVGLVRTKEFEGGLQTAAMTCQLNGDTGPCGGLYDRYRGAATMQLTGLILGPVLLGTGAALILTAVKRKRIAETARVAPMLGRGLYGVGLQGQF